MRLGEVQRVQAWLRMSGVRSMANQARRPSTAWTVVVACARGIARRAGSKRCRP